MTTEKVQCICGSVFVSKGSLSGHQAFCPEHKEWIKTIIASPEFINDSKVLSVHALAVKHGIRPGYLYRHGFDNNNPTLPIVLSTYKRMVAAESALKMANKEQESLLKQIADLELSNLSLRKKLDAMIFFQNENAVLKQKLAGIKGGVVEYTANQLAEAVEAAFVERKQLREDCIKLRKELQDATATRLDVQQRFNQLQAGMQRKYQLEIQEENVSLSREAKD